MGNYFEWTGSTSTMVKYYKVYAEGIQSDETTRIAMRTGSRTGTTGLNWLLGDHLGSTANTLANSVIWIVLKLKQNTTAIEVSNV